VGQELDALIRRADQSDPAAVDELFTLLYGELHRLAQSALRREGGAITLGATTLLHEAWLNMSGREHLGFEDGARFLAYASRAMRGLVIDYARRRQALKRDRQLEITLTEAQGAADGPASEDLIRLGESLQELARVDPGLAGVVDLHFFCGFSFGEIAAMRGVSERTVQRDWRKARMVLADVLKP
jgi:RNA polymerase sigma factor (TIGR02999 family)